jgi:hypothetical protein
MFLLPPAEFSQSAVDLVLGMLPNTAGVEQDRVGRVHVAGHGVAMFAQHRHDHLAVQQVHLAADRFDKHAFRHRNANALGKDEGTRQAGGGCALLKTHRPESGMWTDAYRFVPRGVLRGCLARAGRFSSQGLSARCRTNCEATSVCSCAMTVSRRRRISRTSVRTAT